MIDLIPPIIEPTRFTAIVQSAIDRARFESAHDAAASFLIFRRHYLQALLNTSVDEILARDADIPGDARATSFRVLSQRKTLSLGGEVTVAGQFEETALLHRHRPDVRVGVGIQVANPVVLTAAHCLTAADATFTGRPAISACARVPIIHTALGDLGLLRLISRGTSGLAPLATTADLVAADHDGVVVSFDQAGARHRFDVEFTFDATHIHVISALSPSCADAACRLDNGDSGAPLYVSVGGVDCVAGVLERDDSGGVRKRFTRVDLHVDAVHSALLSLEAECRSETTPAI